MRPLRPRPGRPARDRGSMAVEFVIAGPALVVLLLVVSAGGQWLNLTGQVGAAARDSVRAASFSRQWPQAQSDAQAAAQADLNGICIANRVTVPPPQLYRDGMPIAGNDADFVVAQEIAVTVTCRASLKVFSSIGFPVSQTFTDTAVAPLDPFAYRS
jgi:Flp pilus assembly protein TadG